MRKAHIFPGSSVGRAGGCASALGIFPKARATNLRQLIIHLWLMVKQREKRKYRDRRQYLIAAVHKRRRKIRQMALDYKGGKCQICGYNRCGDALEFHHTDASMKDFSISTKGYTRSWKNVKRELDKCTLLCANCHREIHAQMCSLSGKPESENLVNSGKPFG